MSPFLRCSSTTLASLLSRAIGCCHPEASRHRCDGAPSGSGRCGAQLYTLEQQVAHKAALLSAHFLRPGRPPLLILAHSIGAACYAAILPRLWCSRLGCNALRVQLLISSSSSTVCLCDGVDCFAVGGSALLIA